MLSLALAVTALMMTAAILPMLSIQSVSASQSSGRCPGRALADSDSDSIHCTAGEKKDTGKTHADLINTCRDFHDKCSSSNTNFGETVGNDD